ncbi:MAG: glycosyltransferase 87 family protein [Terriglobales bacterium]
MEGRMQSVGSFAKTPNRSWLPLAVSLLICVGVWHWADAILIPSNTAKVLAAHRPVGNNSDLYPRWLGARELLLHGRDPYSQAVTREIQTGFYGRPLDPANPSDPNAQESFVYPLYVVFLLAPTVTMPFPAVAAAFRWILLFSIALSVPVWMYAVGPRARWPAVVCGVLLALGSYPAIEEYSQQNLTALVALFLAAAVAAIVSNKLILSGALLAMSTVKPDITLPVVLWLLVWAAVREERRRMIWGFVGCMAILLGGAQAISPGWMGQFFTAVREYPRYGTDPSVLQALFPRLVADLLSAALMVFLFVMCWRSRKAAADSDPFGWTLALVSAVTLVVIPKLAAYNQLLLIPALLVLLRHRGRATSFLSRAFPKGAFACQIWQWSAAVVLSILSLLLTPRRLLGAAQLPLYTLLALPPLTLLAVMTQFPYTDAGVGLTRPLPEIPDARRE